MNTPPSDGAAASRAADENGSPPTRSNRARPLPRSQIAWQLADRLAGGLSAEERTAVFVDLGSRDWERAIHRLLASFRRGGADDGEGSRLTSSRQLSHANDDGSRVFIPYAGGWSTYVDIAEHVAAEGYSGFASP